MAGSAKPKRRRAAASGLDYDPRPNRLSSCREKNRPKGNFTFGLLMFLGVTGIIILFVTLDILWGDETWMWAAESLPGGAYGFSACVGICGPCLAALSIFSLIRLSQKSQRIHKGRTLVMAGLCIASTALLVPYIVLVFNAQNTGKWGRGNSTSPSWVFSNYPWLWAVGLLSTMVTIAGLIWVFVACNRRKTDS
ncbi:hypothetical protein ACWD5R_00430 [Streptomyces sp. NPDC002514]|uniref:hypothetical protein n=1 Tax=Streptomyces sp. NPDC001270 TaxID=3364554 RepID=UPI0036C65127